MKLYSSKSFGNTKSDFIMVIANICNIKLKEEVLDKPNLPMLEINENIMITDSSAIVSYLV